MKKNAAALLKVSASLHSAFNEMEETLLLVFDGSAAATQRCVYLQSLP